MTAVVPPRKHPDARYRLCLTEGELQELVAELSAAVAANTLIGFDTETSGLELYGPEKGRVVGLCFSTKAHTGWYVPIRHEIAEGVLDPRQLPDTFVLETLRPFLEQGSLVGHNAKFDWKMMAMEGIICNFVHDTFIIAAMTGEWHNASQYDLKSLTYAFTGVKPLDIEEVGVDPAEERAFEEAVEAHKVAQAAENEAAEAEGRKAKKLKKPKKPKVEIAFHKHSVEDALDYAAADGDNTLQILPILWAKLAAVLDNNMVPYTNIEMPLLPVVAQMEMAGVPIDVDLLNALAVKAVRMMNRAEDATKRVIFDMCGEEWNLNINSGPQLLKLFTERLPQSGVYIEIPNEPGSDSPKKTDTGALSFDASVLELMAKQHPWIHGIMTFKSLKKLHGSFLTKMAAQAVDGRIYANFWQVGTETGRFSSSGPNMQQIPKDQHFFIEKMGEELWERIAAANSMPVPEFQQLVDQQLHDKDVDTPSDVPTWVAPDGSMLSLRKETIDGEAVETVWESWVCRTRHSIKAKTGRYILEADYSQVELRVFAGESGETSLKQAFVTGEDVHTRTASVVFGTPVEEVTKTQRGSAKTINFGIIYGATAKRISESEGIPFREAEMLVRNYFAALPAAKSWIDETKVRVVNEQKSRTHYGRVRNFGRLLGFGSNSGQGHIAMAEREGVNAIVQGTAADIMKIALVRLNSLLRARFGLEAQIVMTVHDSVVLEVADTVSVADIVEAVRVAMSANQAGHLREAQARVGESWVFDIRRVNHKGELIEYPPIDIDVQVGESWGAGTEVKDTGAEMAAPSAVYDNQGDPVLWVLEVLDEISVEQQETLLGFLTERRDDSSNASLRVLFHREGHEPYVKDSDHRYALDFRDVSYLRRIIGNCNLRQDPDALDAPVVLAGVADETIFQG